MITLPIARPALQASDWESVYLEERASLVRAVAAAAGSFQGVEDAVQDAFIAAMKTTPGTILAPRAWLFRVALRAVYARRRREQVGARLGLAGQPTEEIDAALARADILRALRRLDQTDRALIVAKYYLGLTQRELAEALGISRGSVASRISRALARLREQEEQP